MNEFFHMDGYGWFVWPSYVITVLVLGLNIFWACRSLSNAKTQARQRLAMSRESS